MYIDSLVGKRSAASVRRALIGLNTHQKETKNRLDVLGQAYQKAMERIQQQKGDFPTDAMNILAWVVKSRKPLSLGTLRLILAIDAEASKIDKDNFPTADHITQACAPLVVIESETQGVRLAHYTIQEYFERSKDNWTEKFQKLIANTCMTYLSFPNIRSVFKDKNDDEGNFHQYATEFWAYHTKEALSAQGLEIQRVVHFLKNGANSDLWHDSLMQIDLARTNPSASITDDLLQISEEVVEVHVAACLGLSDVVKELIKKGCDPDVRDKRNRSPLWWAAYNGHAGIVELLLEQKVDTEVNDTLSYRTPLELAAKRGPVSSVRLLLDKDADLEPRDSRLSSVRTKFQSLKFDTLADSWRYLNPLASAAEEGHEDISALLLRRGAKIETKSNDGPTISALNVAIKADRESIAKLLLSHGADTEIRDEEGSTALHIAAIHGQTSIVELLLLNNADIKSQNKNGLTILHIAAMHGRSSIVELLLSNGADISSRDKRGLTVLAIAMMYGQTSTVDLLLAHGADMEIRYRDGKTALQIAIQNHRPDIVKLLLLHGADMKARDNGGLTALHFAAISGNDDSVQFLLTHGAHTEIRDDKGCTPLHLAARFNKSSVVKILLTHGGDIEARNQHGETPLITASRNRSREAADLLIAQGADLAVYDNAEQSILSCAITLWLWPTVEQLVTKGIILEDGEAIVCDEMLHSVIARKSILLVDLFLKYGVNVNRSYDINVNYRGECKVKGPWAGNALHKAVASGCVAIVSRLLEVDGIDIEAKDSRGFDAVTAAIRGGQKEIARLLLKSGRVRPAPGQERFFEFLLGSYV